MVFFSLFTVNLASHMQETPFYFKLKFPIENLKNYASKVFHTSTSLIKTTLKWFLYNIRVMLSKMKKKLRKLIATEILNKGNRTKLENRKGKIYNFILDVIDTKFYKPKEIRRKIRLKTSLLFNLKIKLQKSLSYHRF